MIPISPEPQHRAVALTWTSSCAIEFWPVLHPSLTDGSRKVRLEAYRALGEDLFARLTRRFPVRRAPVMVKYAAPARQVPCPDGHLQIDRAQRTLQLSGLNEFP